MKIDKTIYYRDPKSFNDIEAVVRKTKTYKKKIGDEKFKRYSPPTVTVDEFKEMIQYQQGDRFEEYVSDSSLNNVIRGSKNGHFFYLEYEDNLPLSLAIGVKSALQYSGVLK